MGMACDAGGSYIKRGTSEVPHMPRFDKGCFATLRRPDWVVTRFVRLRRIRMFVQGGSDFRSNNPDARKYARIINALSWLILM